MFTIRIRQRVPVFKRDTLSKRCVTCVANSCTNRPFPLLCRAKGSKGHRQSCCSAIITNQIRQQHVLCLKLFKYLCTVVVLFVICTDDNPCRVRCLFDPFGFSLRILTTMKSTMEVCQLLSRWKYNPCDVWIAFRCRSMCFESSMVRHGRLTSPNFV